MNLFILHSNASEAAKMHCDKHIVKMVLELVQMLYAVLTMYGHKMNPFYCKELGEMLFPYRGTRSHPCTLWIGCGRLHAEWALWLGYEICNEYTRRYGKVHKCYYHLRHIDETNA